MKQILIVLLACSVFTCANAQTVQKTPCQTNPVFRQFDFWIGEWEAFATNGKKAGDSKIELILDSCVILENWTSTQQGYKGKSFNTFNSATGKWQQTWVDNTGTITTIAKSNLKTAK